ncbi:hypothetical protein DPEC_G00159370 [Dallia pectoralis]|uniref:Uncharacterized protein n=1 Tax=Dallia pectoralis TaxID=75939 RepID=A0ACC2GG12_DALPE|nr:hypothetical protein DPEC_G00159370 [Dallia pectoralis]
MVTPIGFTALSTEHYEKYRRVMSRWLADGEVLTGEGSGMESPCSPRLMAFPVPVNCGSPRSGPGGRGVRGRSLPMPPCSRETPAGRTETSGSMGKATELFVLCDKEGKGFITKRDMQRLQGELPLTPEQLESVFESLDRDDNGFLTPVEFNMGLMAGGLVWVEEDPEGIQEEAETEEKLVDPGDLRFAQILMDLGAGKLFTDQLELCKLRCELHRDRPELLSLLEDILVQAVYQLQDSMRERDSLEQALRRGERDHDRVVQLIYEEMETRVREEKEKQLPQDSIRQFQDRMQLMVEELKMKEQELETSLSNQKELEERIQELASEQTDIRLQNQQLHSHNMQLQEQLETSRDDLQTTLDQLELLQSGLAEQERRRESSVLKVSRNIQKEKDSLKRQLEMLRDMNKHLRDEKDAHQSPKRIGVNRRHPLFLSPVLSSVLQQSIIPTNHSHCPYTNHLSPLWIWRVEKDIQPEERMETKEAKTNTCGTICLKYLLLTFNLLFWVGGGVVLAVGVWTLVDKSDYVSLLNSSSYSASAYILVAAGAVVIFTGLIGCCAILKETKSLLIVYFILLLCIFLLEISAGVLAYVYHQQCFPFCHQLDEELQQNLKETMVHKYQQPGEEGVTRAVDRLQQEFKCCGSNRSSDWSDSPWILRPDNDRLVPDSCCKTPSERCGQRAHPSNIYRVEGGCVTKLEKFILSQLKILGSVGIGIAFLQLVGMLMVCCLYRNLKKEPY